MLGIIIGVVSFAVFLLFQAIGISAGDSGDLVTAASIFGVPHPPGYPLYTFLGFIASKLPILTVTWRVTLLSSIPHAVTLGLLATIVKRLTKSSVAALMSALMLLGNYNFFHYSITPEVFALLDLFVAAVLYLLIRFAQRGDRRLVILLAFVFGLSLSHHHVILFLTPAMVYSVMSQKTALPRVRRIAAASLVFFLIGFLPYLYIPVAARTDAMINWDRAVDTLNFFRLITRRDYGTFLSGGSFAPELLPRLIALKAYSKFLIIDFGWVMLTLAALGMWRIFAVHRRIAITLVSALFFLGPGFFFYASFPLSSRFSLGTYERFLLPTYLIVALIFGIGCAFLVSFIRHRLIRSVVVLLLFSFIANLLLQTMWRFWGLREDKTAENLAMDILSSVPTGAIVLLAYDTPLFTTQYVRYGLNVREDVRVIHASRLNSPDYRQVVKQGFPDLEVPEWSESGIAGRFVEANAQARLVFTNIPFPVSSSWYWVPHGLLYQAVKEDALPEVMEMYAKNLTLWNSFHHPRAGILGRYPHLMLSDVLDQYAAGRMALGAAMLRAQRFSEAEEQFRQAVDLRADTKEVDALLLLGIAKMYQKKCDEALASFDEAKRVSIIDDERIPLYASFAVRDCLGDSEKADELFSQYERVKQDADIPLDRL